MEKMDKFILEPDLTIYRGVKVDKDTKLSFENEIVETNQKVKQELENLRIKTIVETNRENKYTKSEIIIDLLPGDILAFDESYGYCVPSSKLTTVEDAMEILEAQRSLIEKNMEGDKE